MTQLDNQSGPGIPCDKGRLPSGILGSKQPKSIVATLQQKNRCNQAKLISVTCHGEVEFLLGFILKPNCCLGGSTWNTLGQSSTTVYGTAHEQILAFHFRNKQLVQLNALRSMGICFDENI